jgi:hypothetical protein
MLQEGHRWQVWLSELLTARGFRTEVDPLRCRPSIREYRDYGDEGDVRVYARSGGRRLLACKAVRTGFTGPGDYPYPTVIVDSVKAWDQGPATAVVRISQFTSGVLVIPATTQGTWARQTFKTPDGPKPCYIVARSFCKTLDELCDWLEAT